jgi:putative ABC transport system permease protein
MFRTTLRSLWSHKRRLISTGLAVILGVAFVAGTLVLNATLNRVFEDLFADLGEGIDAVVRGPELFEDGFGDTLRDSIPESTVDQVRAVPGVAAAHGSVVDFTSTLLDAEGDPIGGFGPPTIVGSWTPDDTLNSYQVAQGRAPEAPDEVIIDRGGIDKGGFALGDEVVLVTAAGPETFELVGISRFGEADSAGGSLFVGTTLEAAQRLAGSEGEVDVVEVLAEPGVSQQELVDALAASDLPAEAEVLTGQAYSDEATSDIKQGFSFFTIALLVFAAIALFVGWFIISNTFSILVAQRTRELALLRAIGAGRSQVLGSVMLEAAIIGLVAAGLGVLGGIALAAGAFGLLDALGVAIPRTTLVVQPTTALVGLAVGLGVTLVAALTPAVRATRVPPLAALRDVAVDRSGSSRIRAAFGVLLLVLAVVLASPAFGGDLPSSEIPGVGAGLGLFMLGIIVIGPVIARPQARLVGSWLPLVKGVTGRLARENAMRNPRRTASTAAALIVGVTLVTFITVFASSTKASISQALNEGFRGDFIVQPANQFAMVGVPPTVADDVAKVDGVETVTAFGFVLGQITFPDGDQAGGFLISTDPDTVTEVFAFQMAEGAITDLRPGTIIVDRQIAADRELGIGDSITVLSGDGESLDLAVVAVSDDPAVLGQWTLHRTDGQALMDQPTDIQLGVKVAEGADLEAVRAGIENQLVQYPTVKVQDQEQFTTSLINSITSLLNVIYGLLAVSILISLIGISNTLSLSIHERTRELGLLRAMGMSRSQMRSSVRWEAVIVALLGTVTGILVGLGLSWVMVKALESQGVTTFSARPFDVALIVVLAAAFAVAASVWPAYKASKLNVLEAIATE